MPFKSHLKLHPSSKVNSLRSPSCSKSDKSIIVTLLQAQFIIHKYSTKQHEGISNELDHNSLSISYIIMGSRIRKGLNIIMMEVTSWYRHFMKILQNNHSYHSDICKTRFFNSNIIFIYLFILIQDNDLFSLKTNINNQNGCYVRYDNRPIYVIIYNNADFFWNMEIFTCSATSSIILQCSLFFLYIFLYRHTVKRQVD